MPYDPNLPANNSPLSSAVMRGQLMSLKSLIDAGIPGLTDVVIDSVTTLDPGEPASATASMVGTVLHLTLAIPCGDEGVQGAPGEVTTADLNTAIAGTSSNSNVVDLLEMTVGDPPSQPEVQTIAERLDQLIAALRN